MAACLGPAGNSIRLACGVAVTIVATFSVPLSAQSPAISLTSPASGSVVTGTVKATAAAGAGFAGVQFQVDGVPLGSEDGAAPYMVDWNTRGSSDLVFGVVKTMVAPLTITAGNGFTKRLGVSCPTCTGDDTVSVDRFQSAPGPAGAAFTFSAPARYVAHMAAFKAATTPVFLQGDAATSNTRTTYIGRTFAAPVTAGSLVVAAVAWSGNAPLTVTDNRKNLYAVASTGYDATLGQSVAIVYAANVAAGVTTVTARFGGAAPTVRRLEIHEYAGIVTANPLDATSTNSAAGTTTPGTVTSGSATTTVAAAAANGSHTLTAVARDAAGQRTTSAPVTVTVNNDSTPPVLSNIAASSVTASGATINWTTNEPGTSQVNYGPTTAYASTTALNASLVTTHAVSLNGLATSTMYHVRVRSRDAAGNLAVSGDITFTTRDGAGPTVSVTSPGGGATVSAALTVTATASDNAGVAGVRFLLDGAPLGAEDTTSPYSVSWNTATAANGSHTLTAIARDADGNQATSAGVAVTVNNDTTPPSVSIAAPSAGTTVSGTASVSAAATDNVGVAGVQFQLDGVPLGAEATTAPFAVAWDTTAQQPGAHILTAVARDMAGNRTTSIGVPVTVANSSRLTLSWDASVDPNTAGYKVYIGTTSGFYAVNVVDVSNVTTCTISGLQAGTVYYIAVTSYDESGNEGGYSNELSATIP